MQLSAKEGMLTLDQSLSELVRKKIVTTDEAMLKTSNPDRLAKLLQFNASVSSYRRGSQTLLAMLNPFSSRLDVIL